MKAVESTPPYIHFVFIACLTTLGKKENKTKNKKQPTSVSGIWAPSENLNTFELCISVKYVV